MSKLHINITYPMDNPVKCEVKSDVKDDKVVELLCTWLGIQRGKGEDNREAVDRDIYHINISIELENDSFTTDSDTGNGGLTTGIIMDVVKRLNNRAKCFG